MRTLRKQVDFLHNEITEFSDYQGKLYNQNGQLVEYIRSLLEANKNNSIVLRDQMKTLHEEMRSLHTKRADLAERLTLARTSKDLIKKLQQDLGPLNIKKEKAIEISIAFYSE
jgi:predicted  nucleic acid-binding Zn-ribbon protein